MQGGILIAAPQLVDAHFGRTVVLLWHYDSDGAIGAILNRPMDESLESLEGPFEGLELSHYKGQPLHYGGPVGPSTGTVVRREAVDEEQGWNPCDGIAVSRSMDVLVDTANRKLPFLLCLGQAGWGPGQLDREVEEGSWLWTDLDPALVFDVPPLAMYEAALATLGLTPQTAWMPSASA